jgi:hypothetical protein
MTLLIKQYNLWTISRPNIIASLNYEKSVSMGPFKGIMSRDLGQVHWILSYKTEEFRVTAHILSDFRVSFHDLLLKNQATAVSH